MDTEYERIDITLPTGLLKDFRAFCKTQGMKPSPRIAVLIEKDLEDYYYEQVDKAIFAVRSKAVRPPSAKGNPPKPSDCR